MGEMSEADFEGPVRIVRGDGQARGFEVLSGDGAANREGWLIDDEPVGTGLRSAPAEAANSAVGVADEGGEWGSVSLLRVVRGRRRCPRTRVQESRGSGRCRCGRGHGGRFVTGKARGQDFGDAHPVSMGGDAAMDEEEGGAGAEATEGDASSVGGRDGALRDDVVVFQGDWRH